MALTVASAEPQSIRISRTSPRASALPISTTQKTVVRGSFGIFYFNAGALGGNAQSLGISTLGYSANPTLSSPNGGVTPAQMNWDNGFPPYAHAPFFSSTINTGYNTATGATGGGVSFGDFKLGGVAPYTQDWNLTIERELSTSTVIKVSYSASNSHHLPTGIGRGIYAVKFYPNTWRWVVTDCKRHTCQPRLAQAKFPKIQLPYANFQGSIGQMLQPWPQYTAVFGDNFPNIGNGNYNSLQIAAQRHFSRGLEFLISYTLSKEIDDAGSNLGSFFGAGGRTAYNNKLEKAVGGQDIPNILAVLSG